MGRRRTDLLTASLLWIATVALPRECALADFLRGDFQQSGEVDIGDAIRLLNYLFSGGPPPAPIF